MIIEDLTVLGKTVPEENRSNRIFVCSAGISPDWGGLLRIYPLAWRNAPTRWHTYRVPLERNPKDSRPESFKLAGDRSAQAHAEINQLFEHVGEVAERDRAELLKDYIVGSIKEANARRMSLAILQPEFGPVFYDHRLDAPEEPDVALWGPDPRAGSKQFPYNPRLHFADDCGEHRLQLRDWGCYEWMRKHPDRRDELAACLHLGPRSSLLVGNFHNHRSSWLIVSVLNGIDRR